MKCSERYGLCLMTCDRCRFEGCTLPGLGLETDAERPCGEGCHNEHRRTGQTRAPDGCAMCLDCGVRVEPRLWADCRPWARGTEPPPPW